MADANVTPRTAPPRPTLPGRARMPPLDAPPRHACNARAVACPRTGPPGSPVRLACAGGATTVRGLPCAATTQALLRRRSQRGYLPPTHAGGVRGEHEVRHEGCQAIVLRHITQHGRDALRPLAAARTSWLVANAAAPPVMACAHLREQRARSLVAPQILVVTALRNVYLDRAQACRA
eukprot:3446815-Pleurochrysis_carterae.AAC.6